MQKQCVIIQVFIFAAVSTVVGDLTKQEKYLKKPNHNPIY